ncbi:NAD(P)-binding protein [Cucurbitaria berberidis CBS 394.84]|uniref:NAD(P)-binding protein n=1 Tax=Cucurbitaria berberidis CBS 394.84 TaxID=1168544 RepID=A0A9P4GIG6_9PLEO|nr:NAD(P)-binding protein [Cucurbitaria berberidis CBS 394.84]KAF1846783.1 NAD(P)-binding protein [Cucurbitaria berberidis CBS 394.84]
MAEVQINDGDLTGFKGKVAVITGGSSGIGLAAVQLLVSLGALVVSGDIQAPPATGDFLFVQTDIRSWTDTTKLFKAAKDKHGRVDYVFANAGIGPRANYLGLEVDENGDPKEPNNDTVNTNLNSVVNTATLAAHYMKDQAEGGSIVLMGSSTGLHPVRAVDYSTAKAGVLGFGRSFARLVEVAGLPIRVNTLAPSWTATQVLPDLENLLAAVSQNCQSTAVVARAAAYLMADKSRHGDVIFVCDGNYTEIEKAVLAPAYESIKGDTLSDDAVLAKVMALGG